VEVGITDRSRRISARGALRNLVVNVEVLGATGLLVAIAAMLGEHCCSIGITLEISISKMILIQAVTFRVAGNVHWVDRKHFRPCTEKVDLQADGVAVLVVSLASLIDASLATTLGEELLLGVIVEEDINVALNFLGGRPVNLAVLLQALLLEDEFLVPGPA
jgi:hypothetical protein